LHDINDYSNLDFLISDYSAGQVVDDSNNSIINNNTRFENYIFIFHDINKFMVLF
jgi:alpha-glucuronidase